MFCVSVIVINKYSNSDKQVLNKNTAIIIVVNSGNSDKQVSLYSGGAYIRGGTYIWNEVSVSTCGGLIHGGAYIRGGGLIFGGLRHTFFSIVLLVFSIIESVKCFSYKSISLSWYYIEQIMNVYECNGKNIFIR